MVEDYFTDIVTRRRYVLDSFGRESAVPDDLQLTCRVDKTNRLLITPSGEHLDVKYKVFLGAGDDVVEGDRIVLGIIGTGQDPFGFPVKFILEADDFDSDHLEVWCGNDRD